MDSTTTSDTNLNSDNLVNNVSSTVQRTRSLIKTAKKIKKVAQGIETLTEIVAAANPLVLGIIAVIILVIIIITFGYFTVKDIKDHISLDSIITAYECKDGISSDDCKNKIKNKVEDNIKSKITPIEQK